MTMHRTLLTEPPRARTDVGCFSLLLMYLLTSDFSSHLLLVALPIEATFLGLSVVF